jgi:hypothetical protein
MLHPLIAALIVVYMYGLFYFGCYAFNEFAQEEQDMESWKLLAIGLGVGVLWPILLLIGLVAVICIYFSGSHTNE